MCIVSLFLSSQHWSLYPGVTTPQLEPNIEQSPFGQLIPIVYLFESLPSNKRNASSPPVKRITRIIMTAIWNLFSLFLIFFQLNLFFFHFFLLTSPNIAYISPRTEIA